MRVNVLAANIRDEILIAMRVTVEDQKLFARLIATAELLSAEKESQLQGHIKSWQTRIGVWLGL